MKNFPSAIRLMSPDGKEVLADIPGKQMYEYMVDNGYSKFTTKDIKKAANELLHEALEHVEAKPAKKTAKKPAKKTAKKPAKKPAKKSKKNAKKLK